MDMRPAHITEREYLYCRTCRILKHVDELDKSQQCEMCAMAEQIVGDEE